jgi:polysaccharide chain length determinant protein (PEP-CTERM system associated)
MKRMTPRGPQDYVALIVRRKWWILIPFLALSCAVILFTYILPKVYVSETLILIRPRDVPKDFVRDLIAGSVEQRLATIEQTVLSRTNLVQILNEFEKEQPEYEGLNIEQKILKLRKQIYVNFQFENRGGVQLPLTYFRITYQNRNPELAQKITSKLTSLFIEQDNRTREGQVAGTTEFLSGELEKLSEQIKKSDTELKDLKARRRYELPDQLETNLRTLDRLGLQKQSNAEALDRYATIRLNLERQIVETQAARQLAGAAAQDPIVEEYRRKQLQLNELAAKYTAKHPEVASLKLQLERLRKQVSPEDLALLEQENNAQNGSRNAKATEANPVYQNLISQQQEVKTEFAIRERERQWIEAEIEKYSQRVRNAPQSEQEIVEVLRKNTDLNKQYDDLKKNLTQAKLSESLENKQKGSQFVVMDPANYPLIPTKPVKSTIILNGMLLSLLACIIFAVAVDLANPKIWTHSEIESLLGATVLAEIPQIVTDSDVALAAKTKRSRIAPSLAAATAYGFFLYILYINQGYVLRHLDTIIQRLY